MGSLRVGLWGGGGGVFVSGFSQNAAGVRVGDSWERWKEGGLGMVVTRGVLVLIFWRSRKVSKWRKKRQKKRTKRRSDDDDDDDDGLSRAEAADLPSLTLASSSSMVWTSVSRTWNRTESPPFPGSFSDAV